MNSSQEQLQNPVFEDKKSSLGRQSPCEKTEFYSGSELNYDVNNSPSDGSPIFPDLVFAANR